MPETLIACCGLLNAQIAPYGRARAETRELLSSDTEDALTLVVRRITPAQPGALATLSLLTVHARIEIFF